MNRVELIAAVNGHAARWGLSPVRSFQQAYARARQLRIVSPEHLEWARLGYFPTPEERTR